MKKKYEKPLMEVYCFEIEDALMSPCSENINGGECELQCPTERSCIVDLGDSCIDYL